MESGTIMMRDTKALPRILNLQLLNWEEKSEWVRRLRDGRRRGISRLCSVKVLDGKLSPRYCCLGVYAEMKAAEVRVDKGDADDVITGQRSYNSVSATMYFRFPGKAKWDSGMLTESLPEDHPLNQKITVLSHINDDGQPAFIQKKLQNALATWNDDGGTFEQIANWVEENL